MRNLLVVVLTLGTIAVTTAAEVPWRDSTPVSDRLSAPSLNVPYGHLFEGRAAYDSRGPKSIWRYHLDDVPPVG